jgi:hypothetical protein
MVGKTHHIIHTLSSTMMSTLTELISMVYYTPQIRYINIPLTYHTYSCLCHSTLKLLGTWYESTYTEQIKIMYKLLAPWNSCHEKLPVPQLFKNFLRFTESKGWILYSHELRFVVMLTLMNPLHIINFIIPSGYVGMGDLFTLSNANGITNTTSITNKFWHLSTHDFTVRQNC